MALSVLQLLDPVSKDEALDTILDILDSVGFNATSWQAGSPERTFTEMLAELFADHTLTEVKIAESGFNDTAEGDFLTLLSDSHYDNQRNLAGFTEGLVTLTASADAPGPFTINAGDSVGSDEDNGFTYRNITAGTLVAGGTLQLTYKAEVAGSNRNVPNDKITILQTPLQGVTINNPDPTTGTWITQDGVDEEQDPGLQERNRTKWATLSLFAPEAAYINFAREANVAVTKVLVDAQNPRGAFTIDVFIAGDSGALSPTVVQQVQDFILGDEDGDGIAEVGRAPVEVTRDGLLVTASAVNFPQTISGLVTLEASKAGTAKETEIEAAVDAFFKDAVESPIGGRKLTESGTGALRIGRLQQVINAIDGVLNWAPTAPTADVPLTNFQVVVPTIALTYASL